MSNAKNVNFWLFSINKIDNLMFNHCGDWTLENKGEEFLTNLFHLIIERLLIPKHVTQLQFFQKISLTVSEENKKEILKSLACSLIDNNSEIGFVTSYVKDTEEICKLLKVKSSITWQYLQDYMLDNFFDNSENRDRNDKLLMIYSIILNQSLPQSGKELQLAPSEISKTLYFVNSLLERKMHKIGSKGLQNIVELVRSALKCLNKDIKKVDVEMIKKTIFLFIKENLSASLYEIFNVLISRFASKNLDKCLEYFDDIFQDIISVKMILVEETNSSEQRELTNFILFNLLKIQKLLHNHTEPEKH